MGRGKHCSEVKRKNYKKMLVEGKTFAEISRLLGCSNKMISNAKKFVPKRAEKEPFKPATELKNDLNTTASVVTNLDYEKII